MNSYDYSDPQDRLDYFFDTWPHIMRTKEDVLRDIAENIKRVEKGGVKAEHTETFWKQCLELLNRFQKEVENAILFKELEPHWCYTYEVNEQGAKLALEHIDSVDFSDIDYDDSDMEEEPNDAFTFVDQIFELIVVPARLLSVEEYAAVYNVGVTTVRQWIRRGKIRSAIKNGRTWSIPELAEVSGRGYQGGHYFWDLPLNDFPKEFSFLREARWVDISQNQENKDMYDILLTPEKWKTGEGKQREIQMPTAEKEKLELMLISHPFVKVHSSPIVAGG